MDKYISKSDAVFAACRVLAKFGGCTMGPFCPDSGCKEVREEFDNVPAADVVERPRWHSVTETPPLSVGDPDYYGYLVYSCGYVRVADFTANEFHVDGEYDPDVTNWMPLPPLPREGNHG